MSARIHRRASQKNNEFIAADTRFYLLIATAVVVTLNILVVYALTMYGLPESELRRVR